MGFLYSRGLQVVLSCVFVCVVLKKTKAMAVRFTETVNTTAGPVRGINETLPTGRQVLKYLGIQYAKAKRFEKPTEPQRWNMTHNATMFGKQCPQPSLNPKAPLGELSKSSEDCLFINVFVPSEKPGVNSSGFAVMLWIHGGAYGFGSGGLTKYDGGVLASEEGVVVVTFNYRLGALGYLYTGSDELMGNYGMEDQLQAMKWVRSNIMRFGGDPSKVTLFGESAGAMSVSLLMLSPLTKRLYRNVILQSGAAPSLSAALFKEEAKERAKSFAEALGCKELSELKQCALKKNVSEIITAQVKMKSTILFLPFAPVVDGKFLKDSPMKMLEKGNFQKSGSVLIGVVKDEGTSSLVAAPGMQNGTDISQGLKQSKFKELVDTTHWVRNQNQQIVNAILEQYTNWPEINNDNATRQSFLDMNGDAAFKAPAIVSAQMYGKNVSTYFYEIGYSTSFDMNNQTIPEWRRVYHTAEVQYVFGLPLLKYSWPSNNSSNNTDVAFSKKIMAYWANFAKTGNPNPANQNATSLQWPRYTSDKQEYMSLKPVDEVKERYRADKMRFWNTYLETLKTEEKKPCPEDLTEELEEKEKYILGLAIAVGVLGLLVILLLICVICMKRNTKTHTFDHKNG